jgi:O-antigen/teichoic acid export membrane protein
LSLVAGCVGAVFALVLMTSMGGSAVNGRLWMAVLLAPATLFYLLGTNLLMGLKKVDTFNKVQLGSNYGVLLCFVVAGAAGAGPTGFLAAHVLGWVAASWLLLRRLRRESPGSLRFDREVFGEGFRYALKAYVATLCGFLVVRTNVYLLSGLSGAEQVGYYSVAAQMGEVMGILPQSIALVLFPTLVTARSGKLRTTFLNMAAVALAMGIACVGVGLFADGFVTLVFGTTFLPTASLLRWMLPGIFFLGLTSVLSQYLASCGFPTSLVVVWIGGEVLAAALGWMLIPTYSATGAAIALSIAHTAIFAGVLGVSLGYARRGSLLVGAQVLPEGATS